MTLLEKIFIFLMLFVFIAAIVIHPARADEPYNAAKSIEDAKIGVLEPTQQPIVVEVTPVPVVQKTTYTRCEPQKNNAYECISVTR